MSKPEDNGGRPETEALAALEAAVGKAVEQLSHMTRRVEEAEAKSAEGNQVVVPVLKRVGDLAIVLTLGAEAMVGQLSGIAGFLSNIVIAVGDDVETACDEVVMNLALVLHLLFLQIPIG